MHLRLRDARYDFRNLSQASGGYVVLSFSLKGASWTGTTMTATTFHLCQSGQCRRWPTARLSVSSGMIATSSLTKRTRNAGSTTIGVPKGSAPALHAPAGRRSAKIPRQTQFSKTKEIANLCEMSTYYYLEIYANLSQLSHHPWCWIIVPFLWISPYH